MWSINVNLRLLRATDEFAWRGGLAWAVVGCGGVGWMGGGVHSHFRIQPNYSVEVVFCCVVVGVVTI